MQLHKILMTKNFEIFPVQFIFLMIIKFKNRTVFSNYVLSRLCKAVKVWLYLIFYCSKYHMSILMFTLSKLMILQIFSLKTVRLMILFKG